MSEFENDIDLKCWSKHYRWNNFNFRVAKRSIIILTHLSFDFQDVLVRNVAVLSISLLSTYHYRYIIDCNICLWPQKCLASELELLMRQYESFGYCVIMSTINYQKMILKESLYDKKKPFEKNLSKINIILKSVFKSLSLPKNS